jgi:hypothetical protein
MMRIVALDLGVACADLVHKESAARHVD